MVRRSGRALCFETLQKAALGISWWLGVFFLVRLLLLLLLRLGRTAAGAITGTGRGVARLSHHVAQERRQRRGHGGV